MSQKSLNGLTRIRQFEAILMGASSTDVLEQYPEIDVATLSLQMPLFRKMYPFRGLQEALAKFINLDDGAKPLFNFVGELLKLIVVCPVTIADVERSFSSLRRLKTWLRSTMSQERLTHVALCSIHKERLKKIDIESCISKFVEKSSFRLNKFGA